MRTIAIAPAAVGALALAAPLTAQPPQIASGPTIIVSATLPPAPAKTSDGPEIKGMISAHNGAKIRVTGADGNPTDIGLTQATVVRASNGLFGGGRREPATALLNGLPVVAKTYQSADGLIASEVTFKSKDYKIAAMIRGGTDQRFSANEAATEALRGRVSDIDNYNIKSTTNVYFATGRAELSAADKANLCSAASQAEAINNAMLLVVGYTDSTGSDEINQTLSEKRAMSVIHHLQQVCHWKPYRLLTPTGMATADPAADNATPEGRAQNRRVAVNVLVSKAVDGM